MPKKLRYAGHSGLSIAQRIEEHVRKHRTFSAFKTGVIRLLTSSWHSAHKARVIANAFEDELKTLFHKGESVRLAYHHMLRIAS